MATTQRPLVATTNPRVRDAVLSAIAAAGLEADVAEDADALKAAADPTVLVLGVDLAPAAARLELLRRTRVRLVGETGDSERMCAWSAALGAAVITLPEGLRWLTGALAEAPPGERGRVVAVLGGSGGVGTSTLTVDLAWQLARRGRRVAVVELDPGGPGLDLLLGLEREPGWRWPALASAAGFLGDLADRLPGVDGVAVLARARGHHAEPGTAAVRAVLQSLARQHQVVLLDLGRAVGGLAAEALEHCDGGLLLCRGTVPALGAAVDLLDRLDTPVPLAAVLRGSAGDRSTVGELLGIPLLTALPEDHRVASAADLGEVPVRVAGRGWRRATATLVAELAPAEGER
ncbi:septum site-determining protein Ssd [Enemella dayhoffiae]|nr:septum site-determining protein Ssd [Enemella dayhoffiae]